MKLALLEVAIAEDEMPPTRGHDLKLDPGARSP